MWGLPGARGQGQSPQGLLVGLFPGAQKLKVRGCIFSEIRSAFAAVAVRADQHEEVGQGPKNYYYDVGTRIDVAI